MADITEIKGNIFLSDADAITITVNCEGVMGAGIALEARLRWPDLFERYRTECTAGHVEPGHLLWWVDPLPDAHLPEVVCFPTKDRWRAPSRIEFIRSGLSTLALEYRERGIASIAMPHLGCSHGGLEWPVVRDEILRELGACDGFRVELWEFDPEADDPWFDRLVASAKGRTEPEVAELLGLTPAQARALLSALENPRVKGLAALQQARGVGEKTLVRIYEYLFRGAAKGRGEQGSLFP